MANVKAVDTYRFSANIHLELAGKLRTYLKGRRLPARKIAGRGIRKPDREMTPSDFFEACAERELAPVKMDAESCAWVERELAKNLEKRKKVVAANLAKRKSPEEKLKSGPKKGKRYPKFLAAMKKLAEERRANRITNRNETGKAK